MDGYWMYALIPIVAIIAWACIRIAHISNERGGGSKEVLARLDAIDDRLAAVEKTLNDIP